MPVVYFSVTVVVMAGVCLCGGGGGGYCKALAWESSYRSCMPLIYSTLMFLIPSNYCRITLRMLKDLVRYACSHILTDDMLY